jgi:hypothetical protein
MIASCQSNKELEVRAAPVLPFNTSRLVALLEEARLDALLVTRKHNIQ